jgi:hypothetical protein
MVMRVFAEKPKATKQIRSFEATKPGRANLGQDREDSALHSQHTIKAHAGGSTAGTIRFSHDFSKIPVKAATPFAPRTVPPTETAGEQVTDKEANRAEHTVRGSGSVAHDFGTLRILPIQVPIGGTALQDDIPVAGGIEEIDDAPPGDGTTTGAPAPGPAAADSCEQPRSMHKVTSGAFLGGLTIVDYYPDISSRGYPSAAGPFDVGNRAGANIQLYGVIPSPCLPSQFHLEQTITRKRFRNNGVAHSEEGKTFNDIAKSGRDASRPPFRQEFLGGGAAPLGYIISMADPPSTAYNSTSTIEHDRDFVTSLVGPSGRQSISWSLSTRISGGTVTSNVLA